VAVDTASESKQRYQHQGNCILGGPIAAIGNLATGFLWFYEAVVGRLIMGMILGFGFSSFAGFNAGCIAKHSQVLNGGIVGAIGLLVVCSTSMSPHLLFNLVRIVGLMPIGMGGGDCL
jgi:hypothetical protein